MGTVLTFWLIDVVAPVSPRLLVNARMLPAMTAELIIGNRTFLNAWNGFAPRVIAISSQDGSTSSIAPMRFLTTNG